MFNFSAHITICLCWLNEALHECFFELRFVQSGLVTSLLSQQNPRQNWNHLVKFSMKKDGTCVSIREKPVKGTQNAQKCLRNVLWLRGCRIFAFALSVHDVVGKVGRLQCLPEWQHDPSKYSSLELYGIVWNCLFHFLSSAKGLNTPMRNHSFGAKSCAREVETESQRTGASGMSSGSGGAASLPLPFPFMKL